jgi:SsrA-binding protein
VKSCRKNQVQLSDALAEVRDGEVWLINCHISEYNRSSMRENHKPKRTRKLLLNRKEVSAGFLR